MFKYSPLASFRGLIQNFWRPSQPFQVQEVPPEIKAFTNVKENVDLKKELLSTQIVVHLLILKCSFQVCDMNSILPCLNKQYTIKITFWVFYTEGVLQVYAILHVSRWKLKTGTCPTIKGSWHLALTNLNWKVPEISTKLFFTITTEIHARSLANFYCPYADVHINLKFMWRVSEREQAIRQFVIVKNKLTSVF